jgi:hypothetical protein
MLSLEPPYYFPGRNFPKNVGALDKTQDVGYTLIVL